MGEQKHRQADGNKQVVADFFRLVLDGDMDGVMACQTEDFEWAIATGAASGIVPWFQSCQGRDAALALLETFEAAGDLEVFEITDYYGDGDKVFALGREKVASKTTGKSFETGLFYVATMRDGKIAKLELACDTAAAMVAFTAD